ncbi:MAG TPA: Type 1 glutamine amidotransferase-like domain-containing protein, partial [Bauldia sp.]|nr:Type 1 glutamine amidotransferase-like domain-containing protein [Bauldia sp.]
MPATKSSRAKSSGPATGTLLLIGGGRFGTELQEEIVRLGRAPDGRAEWVFIPTAETDEVVPTLKPLGFIARTADRVTMLHTRDRAEADSEDFTAPLHTATAVFLFGGRQFRLVDAYTGTRTERALRGVLERGRLLAGVSAGATIMGSYLVRGHPSDDASIMMWPGYDKGWGYLTNVAIDQHVSARGREAHLAEVVAARPELLGIGLDEGTA